MNRKKILVVKQEEVERQIHVRHMIRLNPRWKKCSEFISTRSFYFKSELCPCFCPQTLHQRRQERNQLTQELQKKTKQKADWSRREEERLRKTSGKILEICLTAKPEHNQLEKRVEHLEKKYKYLTSSLEMDKKKAERAKDRKNVELSSHMRDNESAGDVSDK